MESKVADTILEKDKVVKIGGVSYNVAPPSIATLILFSKYTAKLPKEMLDRDNAIASLLQNAPMLEAVGGAMASLILGAEKFEKLPLLHQILNIFRKKDKIRTKGEQLSLTLNKAPIDDIVKVFFELLKFMNLKSFFQLTTSLIEMNLTKPTKEVGTTASGQ